MAGEICQSSLHEVELVVSPREHTGEVNYNSSETSTSGELI